jgi:hypothetical protein
MWVVPGDCSGNLKCQSGFAAPAHAAERQQPRMIQASRDFGQLLVAANEAAEQRGQVVVSLRRGRFQANRGMASHLQRRGAEQAFFIGPQLQSHR